MRRIAVMFAVGTLGVACQALVGDYRLTQGKDTAPLCVAELETFVVELDLASKKQLPLLEDYYIRANPQLVEHLTAVAHDHLAGTTHRSVTYLLGDAGIGKSYVMRNAFNDFKDDKCEVTLREWTDGSQPDLTSTEGLVFNSLPAILEPTKFDLSDVLEGTDCFRDGAMQPFIFLDGIDEVHDQTASLILSAVDSFVRQDRDDFLHIVIAGRPEGFRPWLTDPSRTERNVSQFHLKAPEYRTLGDLEFRLRGYLDYVGDVSEIDARGAFDSYLRSFVEVLSSHPFLTYSLGNLALGNFAIQHTFPGLDESERQIKAGILDDWLARNSETHNRPGAGSELDGQYRRILEDVAAQYLASVGDDGEFSVATQDNVAVVDEAGRSAGYVRVRDVLLHSGVAYLTSASSTTTRFRFSPFWLHGFLAEGYNQRQGEAYRGCESITAL